MDLENGRMPPRSELRFHDRVEKSACAKSTANAMPDDTVMDIIRRGAGNDFDEIERRARELNEKIDAGTLDESDI